MLVPLYGFLRGDSIGLLVLVQDSDPVKEIAVKLQEAASVRVPPKPRAEVYYQGTLLDGQCTVAQAGLVALERVDVVTRDA